MSGGIGAVGNYISVLGIVYQLLNPQKIYGPKLSDGIQQTSQEGVPIPFGYGTFPCGGNVIWAGPLVEEENRESGKGGPVQITYSYHRSYALGICEGEITGILQVKRNGKLVYDVSPGSTLLGSNAKFLEKATFYLGTETQTIDPTIEAEVGVGNVPPYLGLAYMVVEEDDLTETQGAIPQYEFVVQKCGAVTNLADATTCFIASLNSAGDVCTSTRGGTWTNHLNVLSGGAQIDKIAAHQDVAVGFDGNTPQQFWRSPDRGATWALATDASTANRQWRDFIAGFHGFVAIGIGTGVDAGKSYVRVSTDDGDNYTETQLTGIVGAEGIGYGGGLYVLVTDGFGGGIYTASSPQGPWTNRSSETNVDRVFYNGTDWLCVGDNARTVHSADGITFTLKSQIGTGVFGFWALTGGPGYFIAGATAAQGIFKTVDNGANWTDVSAATGTASGAAAGLGVIAVSFNTSVQFSTDEGDTWTPHNPGFIVNDIAFFGPRRSWFTVPDAPDLYADEDGVLVTDYLGDSEELSTCSVTLAEIVGDLCERVGIESTEYDVSALTTEIAGYKCATESSASGFIEPLAQAFCFDRGEWDKKIRFIPRGGSSVAALTMDDLVFREPAIEKEQAEEPELLRKINVRTVDPASQYAFGKQTWERRSGVVVATGESTLEVPIVCDVDTAAQIAERLGKVAWSETDTFKFGLSVAYSKLTPTDIVTLTDRAGVVHRLRLVSTSEESGVFMVEEAKRDRASTYTSSATGVGNPNFPDPVDGIVGPTLLAVMNLPQLRSQDTSTGAYVGMCGILPGWPGAQLLMSVDGGVSYAVVKTVTEPTIMGTLVADLPASNSPDVAYVHVFGGDLESKTTAQVAAGANLSAVITDDVSEVLSYEDATETTDGYYTLATLDRGAYDTTAAAHDSGDTFVDLTTAFFLPISDDYIGDTLYFKAVTFGISVDAVDPVAFVYEGWEIILDGGEIT